MLLAHLSTLLLLATTLYFIKKYSFFRISPYKVTWSYVAFIAKCFSGIAVWLIYTYYYTERVNADIYKYFDDAQFLIQQTKGEFFLRWKLILGFQNEASSAYSFLEDTSFWFSQKEVFFNDNRTMTRIHMVLLHLSGGVFHFHTLFFSFISFVGSLGIFHFFKRFTVISSSILLSVSFFIPSVLLWTSAPLKESYLLFSIGVLLWRLVKFDESKTVSSITILVLALLNLLLLKVYIILSLLPGLLFWLSSKQVKSKKQLLTRFVLIHFLGLVLAFIFQNQFMNALITKQQQFIELLTKSNAQSGISIVYFNDLLELILVTPQLLFNVFIRPLFPPNLTPFSLLAAFEHFLLLLVLIAPIFSFKIPSKNTFRFFLFSLSFIVIAGIIIGSTTPIIGAIVRYKAPLIPFYLIAIFTFVDTYKLTQRFK